MFFLLTLIISFGNLVSVYAQETSSNKEIDDKLKNKVQNQTNDIQKNLKDNFFPSKSQEFDNALQTLKDRHDEESGDINVEGLRKGTSSLLFNLSVGSRAYLVPVYMLYVIYNIVMIGTVGAKSLRNRKVRIIGIITTTIVLILFLNIPLMIIYFQDKSFNGVFGSNVLLNGLYNFIMFLKANSITVGAIFIVYGIINMILGRNDIPRKVQGSYMIKIALLMILILQGLPLAMSLII